MMRTTTTMATMKTINLITTVMKMKLMISKRRMTERGNRKKGEKRKEKKKELTRPMEWEKTKMKMKMKRRIKMSKI